MSDWMVCSTTRRGKTVEMRSRRELSSSSKDGRISERICFASGASPLSLQMQKSATAHVGNNRKVYLSCASFTIRDLCSSGIAESGGSCLSSRCSIISRNLTISVEWSCRMTLARWKEDGPCIASDDFSNDIGFCLKMTLPFFNSARGFFAATRKKDASG
jgi:hypothetical protein